MASEYRVRALPIVPFARAFVVLASYRKDWIYRIPGTNFLHAIVFRKRVVSFERGVRYVYLYVSIDIQNTCLIFSVG